MFRSLKSTGKHAAPKGYVPEARPEGDAAAHPHRPAHAATMPRLTGSHVAAKTTGAERRAA